MKKTRKYETAEQFYEAAKIRNREWYADPDNRESKKAYNRKRYLEKREEILAQNRARYYKRKQEKAQREAQEA